MKPATPYVLLGLLLATGCKQDADTGCGSEAPTGYRVFLRTRLQQPGNPYDPTPPQLMLFSNDSESYTCGGYQLITSFRHSGNAIWLDYCGVKAPSLCLATIGAASDITSLQELPAQRYNLNINVRGRITTGTLDLTVSPAQLTISDTTVAAVRP